MNIKFQHSFYLGNNDFNKWYDDIITASPYLYNKSQSIMGLIPLLFVSIFDFPARAKAMNKICHTAYSACINCNIEGDYKFNKVFYPFKKIFRIRKNINSV